MKLMHLFKRITRFDLSSKRLFKPKMRFGLRNAAVTALTAALLLSCSDGAARASELSGESASTSPEALSASAEPPAVYSAPEGETPWYKLCSVVAHALGNIDGRSETNSAEAFAATYAKGQRVFEVDLVLTSDGHLVARHDFTDSSYYTLEQKKSENQVMDLQSFLSAPIMGIYTPVTAEDIAGWMAKYDDMWIVTDTKSSDAETVKAQFEYLRNAFGSDSRLDRVIVQLYSTDMYDTVNSVYPFKNYIFTVYQLEERDYNQIGRFCAEHGIAVVAMPASTADTKVTALLHSYGL